MAGLVGRMLKNRYQVEEFLGRGGMADVYKVRDTRRGVMLAMKVLREDLAEDRVFLNRFQREAGSLAKLQHPNIIRFYGLEQEGRLAFILMEYVEGSTLRGRVFDSGQPLQAGQIFYIIAPICNALYYAHQHGMVHCDVKTSNIMLDQYGKSLLMDFGIARMTDAATSTMFGAGTPAYMAPELARGQDPTPKSDIYSLGIVLYELATGGNRPFTGEKATIAGTTAEKVRWEQINLPPVPPSAYYPSINPELEKIILVCLAKTPANRFADTLQVAAALEKCAAGSPASGRKQGGAQWQPAAPRSAQQGYVRKSAPPEAAYPAAASRAGGQRSKGPGLLPLALVMVAAAAGLFLILNSNSSPNKTTGINPAQPSATIAPLDAGQPADAETAPLPEESQGQQAPNQYTKTIGIGNYMNLSLIDEFSNLSNPANLIAFSPDNQLLAMGGIQRVVLRQLDGTGSLDHFYEETTAESFRFSPQGSFLAAGSTEGNAVLWQVHDRSRVNYFTADSQIVALDFSPDEAQLYGVSLMGKLYIWRTSDGALVEEKAISDGLITDAAFSPNHSLLALGLNGGNIEFYRIPDGNLASYIEVYMNADFPLPKVSGMAFSPDGKRLAVTDSNYAGVRIWNISNNKIIHTLESGQGLSFQKLAFSPDGSILAAGTFGGEIYLWDAQSGAPATTLQAHSSAVTDVEFSPDGALLGSISENYEVAIFGVQ